MKRTPTLDGDLCRIPLAGGAVAICDAVDLPTVARYQWNLPRDGYPETKTRVGARRVTLRLHRLLCPPEDGREVDHVNGDRLDARRCNLRPCSASENRRNRRAVRHGLKGAKRHRRRWQARITVDGVTRHLGTHATEEAAARAYDDAAREFFGEFARCNFSLDGGAVRLETDSKEGEA